MKILSPLFQEGQWKTFDNFPQLLFFADFIKAFYNNNNNNNNNNTIK